MFLITWACGMLVELEKKCKEGVRERLTVCSEIPPSTMVPFTEGTVPAV
jgi:hypothetical protein